jgi:hypothetical protein
VVAAEVAIILPLEPAVLAAAALALRPVALVVVQGQQIQAVAAVVVATLHKVVVVLEDPALL